MPEDFSAPPPPPAPEQAPSQQPAASYQPYSVPPPYAPPAPSASPYPGYAYAPPQPRRRSAWFWLAVIGGPICLLGLILFGMAWSISRTITSDEDVSSGSFHAGGRIAVIEIAGVITDSEKIDTQLRKYADDDSVKAILLHIDSPGGGAAASQIVYHQVLDIRQNKKKKVIASIDTTGASGAYYIASACDKIYANQASIVGSIGVIMEMTTYADLLHWAKLKHVVFASGDLKDAGDPARDPTPKEQAYFQSLIDNMFGQFVHDVATSRHTTEAKLLPLATGQVWTGQQALPLGLIDSIGDYHTALIETARSVGISGEPDVVRPAQKKGLAAILNGDADDLLPTPTKILSQAPGFYFLWK